MHVLLVNPANAALPEGTEDLIRRSGWGLSAARDYRAAASAIRARNVDAAIIPGVSSEKPSKRLQGDFDLLLQAMRDRRVAGMIIPAVHDRGASKGHRDVVAPAATLDDSLIDTVDRGLGLSELRGRLEMIALYHRVLRRMERELGEMERLSGQLRHHFFEVDEEMRLAGRLQLEFLPEPSQRMGNVQFAGLYRPATWVSGDIFDVFPAGDGLVAFYVADVVGHGVGAGLLTMFIKRTVAAAQVDSRGPSEILTALNRALVEQNLPSCQFVTACYGLIHLDTLTLEYARGGHPHPVHLPAGGPIRKLPSEGILLGVVPDGEFPAERTHLQPGDKLLLYTDGVETAYGTPRADELGDAPFLRILEEVKDDPIDAAMDILASRLYEDTPPDATQDDITILGLEILKH